MLLPAHLVLALDRTDETLRYGENPHQPGARYRRHGTTSWWDGVIQHGGLALSYLNYYDADAAWLLVHDLGDGPACAIIKHANPCGVSVDDDLADRVRSALACDERSAFGGIVALNRPIDDRDGGADGRGTAGRRRDRAGLRARHDRGAAGAAQEHAHPRGAPSPEPRRSTCARSRVASSCRRRIISRRRAATGGSSPRSRRRPSSGPISSSRGGCAVT